MYGWWDKSTTREERRILRRKPPPMVAPLPTWLVLGFGVALFGGFVLLLLRTDGHRMTVGFSVCLLMICLIIAVSKLRSYVDRLKRQERTEHTHHGELE